MQAYGFYKIHWTFDELVYVFPFCLLSTDSGSGPKYKSPSGRDGEQSGSRIASFPHIVLNLFIGDSKKSQM